MEPTYPPAADYKAVILAFDAPAFAKMNEPSTARKYTKSVGRLPSFSPRLEERTLPLISN
jgi:hypothetical protein